MAPSRAPARDSSLHSNVAKGFGVPLQMTSQPVQDTYAKLSLPIWKSSYEDPAITSGQEELISAASKSLSAMYPRPMTPRYQEMSMALQQGIQEALLGMASPKDALQGAADNSGL